MADIHIVREHALGLEHARRLAFRWAEVAEKKLDMECTIVHELVHIQVSPLDARDAHIREEVVNKIMVAVMNRQCPN